MKRMFETSKEYGLAVLLVLVFFVGCVLWLIGKCARKIFRARSGGFDQ